GRPHRRQPRGARTVSRGPSPLSHRPVLARRDVRLSADHHLQRASGPARVRLRGRRAQDLPLRARAKSRAAPPSLGDPLPAPPRGAGEATPVSVVQLLRLLGERMTKPWLKRGETPPQDFRIFKLQTIEVEDPRTARRYQRVVMNSPDWVNVVAVTDRNEL